MRVSARLIAIAICTAALLAACRGAGSPGSGGAPGSPSREPTATPLLQVDIDLNESDLVGTLGGDPQLEGGCAWVAADDGETYEVVYPDGWEVIFDPLQLVDPEGEVRAEEGDRIGLNGEVAEDAASICQIGPIFRATEVLTDD